ncbi:MAG TPA: hypothetical protein PLV70_08325 [Flavobacteriales bacterium]|nr:hypothetical protein [Flavobacteriales bacterium]HRN37920.1 hypothetical protein [Flavobacteriales bacterium]HRO40110.1 hypothetical protein [Flavobacteriales bacterium]HRP82107.1 hypothetical protein [Flavobacteriales bacterium]HRQ85100.1 hypothetical protein [Flavobacteriales bacterium]
MEHPRFPLYRRSSNGLNWYRIGSESELTEVQQVGSRRVVHHLTAHAYPERLRIRSLIDMEDGHVEECSPEEVEELLAKVR